MFVFQMILSMYDINFAYSICKNNFINKCEFVIIIIFLKLILY